jgi:hypothetical protein
MRPNRIFFAVAVLASLAGCYPPTQTSYTSPTALEQPQPLHPSYGYGGSATSAPPLPLTLSPPCTVCNRTSTIVTFSWWP